MGLYRKRGRRSLLQLALDNLGWSALIKGDHQRSVALFQESLELCKDLGDKRGGSESIEGLACVAGAGGEATRAARLFGVAEALREATGYQLGTRARSRTEPYLAGARAQVDEAAWSAAWEKGRSMEFEDAVIYALEGPNG